MKTIALCYHDVIDEPTFACSGFPGAEAASYKLDRNDFQRHLEAIARAVDAAPINVIDLMNGRRPQKSCLLTFDDGGSSAYNVIAPMLEAFGWTGHFFITTNYIGSPGFLTAEEIRALRNKGHVIGSHSCSHRGRMSSLPWDRLIMEWSGSVEILSSLLGEPVTVASVPSGYYSRKVAQAASASGLRALFTLEPTARAHYVNACLVLGRYTLKKRTPAQTAARIVAGSPLPRLQQRLLWNLKKTAKSVFHNSYPKLRKAYFSWSGRHK